MREKIKSEWKGVLKAIFVIAVLCVGVGVVMAAWDDTKNTSDTLTAAEWNGQVTDQKNRTNTATLVVAASDSRITSTADYVCNGNSDETEINNAINALDAVGGEIVFLEGNYVIDGTIILAKNSTTLSGMGLGTKVTLAGGSNCNMLQIGDGTAKTGIIVRNIFFNGNVTGQTYVADPGDINIILLKTNTNYVTIEDCRFENSTNRCITDNSVAGYTAEFIRMLNNDFYNNFYHVAFGMGTDTSRDINYISIIGNHITSPQAEHDGAAGDGISVGHCNETLIADNKLYDIRHNGIWIGTQTSLSMYRAIVANNYLDTTWDDGIQMVHAENSIISGNTIRNPNHLPWAESTNQGIKMGEAEYNSISSNNVVVGNIVIDDRAASNSARGITSEYNSQNNTIAYNYVSGFEGGNIWIDGASPNANVFGNMGWTTENNVLSPTFVINSTGVKTVTIPHGLDVTPALKDCQLTVVENTNVDDWGYSLLKVESVGATNVVAKINVSSDSATGGATANLALRIVSGNS